MAGWTISDGLDLIFPGGTTLDPGEYLVIARDPAAVEAAYGITGVLGPSGAGKTTLLEVISGLTRPDAGHVKVDEEMLFDSRSSTVTTRHLGHPASRADSLCLICTPSHQPVRIACSWVFQKMRLLSTNWNELHQQCWQSVVLPRHLESSRKILDLVQGLA